MAASDDNLSDSARSTSATVIDIYCETCKATDGLHLAADGYCKQCCEYLCTDCCKQHKKQKPSRHHEIIDAALMPKREIKPSFNDELLDTCPEHSDKTLEYFCIDHNKLCCHLCFNIYHRPCYNKSYIPGIAEGMLRRHSYKDLVIELEHLLSKATSEEMLINLNAQENDACRTKAIANIEAGRKIVDALMDKLVAKSVNNVNTLHKKNAETIKAAAQKSRSITSEIKTAITVLTEKAKAKRINQLFIATILKRQHITVIETDITAVKERNMQRYIFKEDEIIQELPAILSAMFTRPSRQYGENTKCHFLSEVGVKAPDDTHDCTINGIAVMDKNRLVVTDHMNSSVKLVNLRDNKVVHSLTMSTQPADVIRTDVSNVAVALGREAKIEMLAVSDVLTRTYIIDLSQNFIDFCFNGTSFIVLHQRARSVTMVDKKEISMTTIFQDSDAKPVFQKPRFITLGQNKDIIYITDRAADSVTTMTIKGQLLSVCKHDAIESPRGVAVGRDGTVYVCSGRTDTVLQLTTAGRYVKLLMDASHGLAPGPYFIAYCGEEERLYISSASTEPRYCNFVKLFQLE